MPQDTGNSNFAFLARFSVSMASVYSTRSKLLSTNASSRALTPLWMKRSKNAMSASHSSSAALKIDLRKSSARSASSDRSANASSGSIIQNSARCRRVLLFSARKVGPNV